MRGLFLVPSPARTLICTAALGLFCLSAGSVDAQALCPITQVLVSDSAQQQDGQDPLAGLGAADRFYIAMAELNGHLDGVPRVLFQTGGSQLFGEARQCVQDLGRLFRRAAAASSGVGANRATLRTIGHTDPSGNEATNFNLSLRRARHVAGILRGAAGVEVSYEGRGADDPWFCGVAPGAEGAAEGIRPEVCKIVDAGAGGAAPVTSAEVDVGPDRRVEIQLVGSSLAGPRLAALSDLPMLGDQADINPGLAFFAQRMRLFPQGTAPLAPVIVEVGERIARPDVSAACQPGDSPSTDWIPVGEYSQGSSQRQFDESRLYARLGMVPVVTRSDGAPQSYALQLLLATGLIVPVAPVPAHAAGLAAAVDSDTATEPRHFTRHALGLGAPDYWRVRLLLAEELSRYLESEAEDTLLAISACWTPPEEYRSAATDPVQSAAESMANWLTASARRAIPLDYDALWAEAHDFDRRTRMFGLAPGQYLRMMAGGYGLPFGLELPQPVYPLQFGVQQDLYLYAAPTAINTGLGFSGNPSPANRAFQAGPAGHLSVSLYPELQLPWQGIVPSTDAERLPRLAESAGSPFVAYYLDNPIELERFLRGRVVRVFQPGPTRSGGGALMDPVTPDERQLTPGGASDERSGVSDRRDTILLGAPTIAQLEEVTRIYQLLPQLRLASNNDSLCAVLAMGIDSDNLSDEDNRRLRDLHQAGVRCGYFRNNMHWALLVDAAIGGREDRIALGTRLGAFMQPDQLQPCFASAVGPDETALGFADFAPMAAPYWELSLRDLGGGFGRPDIVDAADCRLLALPILGGGEIEW